VATEAYQNPSRFIRLTHRDTIYDELHFNFQKNAMAITIKH
jgi:hypothetical protein